MVFSMSVFAKEFSFIDQPSSLFVKKDIAHISFQARASMYKVKIDSKCFKLIEKSVEQKSQLNFIFKPKNLTISSCKNL